MKMKGSFMIIIGVLLTFCQQNTSEEKWVRLFNGKDLEGWETYLGPKYDMIQEKFDGEPIGANIDPNDIFSVVEVEGELAIRISGEFFGGINTLQEFENYHLQLQFKWGQKKWVPRKDKKRDSGLLYHGIGNHGEHDTFWLRSQECQIQEGDVGDYWGVGNAMFDIPASDTSDFKVYHPNGQLTTFSTTSDHGRHCIKYPDAEKPTGEWNTVDLFCVGDTSVHMVNGKVNMILYNSRYFDGSKEVPLKKGKIQIQSEGAEVFYKEIKIRSITKLPEKLNRES